MSPHRLILVLGGARPSTYRLVEDLTRRAGRPVYHCTPRPLGPDGLPDPHQQPARRPSGWRAISPAGGIEVRALFAAPTTATVLLDGLEAWLAHRLHDGGLFDDDGRGHDPANGTDGAAVMREIEQAVDTLVRAARARRGLTIVVADEDGTAPDDASRGTRRWLATVSRAQNRLSADADRVLMDLGGRPFDVKPVGVKGKYDPDAVPPSVRFSAPDPSDELPPSARFSTPSDPLDMIDPET